MIFLAVLVAVFAVIKYRMVGRFFSRLVDMKKLFREYLIHSILVFLILLIFSIILLRPQAGFTLRESVEKETDLLVLLDVSRSMLVSDVEPDRLSRAKSAIRYLAESTNGRIGLILFAGDAFLQCPLTSDKEAFAMYLEYASPESIALQGTDIGGALDEAVRVFDKKKVSNKVALLITDGEDHEKGVDKALKALKEKGVRVFTASVGQKEGDVVPVTDEKSADVYLHNSKGDLVRSGADTGVLKKIAKSTGASFFDINSSVKGVQNVARALSSDAEKGEHKRYIEEPKERFQIFGVVLLVLLLLELVLFKFRRVKQSG